MSFSLLGLRFRFRRTFLKLVNIYLPTGRGGDGKRVLLGFCGLGFYKIKVLRHKATSSLIFYGMSPLYSLSVPFLRFEPLTSLRRAHGFFVDPVVVHTTLRSFYRTLQRYFLIQSLPLSFTGKGYKLVKNKLTTLTFSFGHSHRYFIYSPQLCFVFRTKTRGYFLGLTRFILARSFSALLSAKPINIFTGRGVRARKQLIFRKVGKLSLYM